MGYKEQLETLLKQTLGCVGWATLGEVVQVDFLSQQDYWKHCCNISTDEISNLITNERNPYFVKKNHFYRRKQKKDICYRA